LRVWCLFVGWLVGVRYVCLAFVVIYGVVCSFSWRVVRVVGCGLWRCVVSLSWLFWVLFVGLWWDLVVYICLGSLYIVFLVWYGGICSWWFLLCLFLVLGYMCVGY